MDLKELLNTRPEELAKLQFIELKKHVIEILTEVIECIEMEKFNDINTFVSYLPVEEPLEKDHHFIDFDFGISFDGLDICEIVTLLAKKKEEINNG